MTVVRGYHATNATTAHKLLTEGADWEPSSNGYDWLGSGIYFWQDDVQRAWEFGCEGRRGWPPSETVVLEADIELGNCLDLIGRQYMKMLKQVFDHFENEMGSALPNNTSGRHARDCLVVDRVAEHWMGRADTVRGVFIEGDEVYPGSVFRTHQHVQIAVRNPDCITLLRAMPTGGLP